MIWKCAAAAISKFITKITSGKVPSPPKTFVTKYLFYSYIGSSIWYGFPLGAAEAHPFPFFLPLFGTTIALVWKKLGLDFSIRQTFGKKTQQQMMRSESQEGNISDAYIRNAYLPQTEQKRRLQSIQGSTIRLCPGLQREDPCPVGDRKKRHHPGRWLPPLTTSCRFQWLVRLFRVSKKGSFDGIFPMLRQQPRRRVWWNGCLWASSSGPKQWLFGQNWRVCRFQHYKVSSSQAQIHAKNEPRRTWSLLGKPWGCHWRDPLGVQCHLSYCHCGLGALAKKNHFNDATNRHAAFASKASIQSWWYGKTP